MAEKLRSQRGYGALRQRVVVGGADLAYRREKLPFSKRLPKVREVYNPTPGMLPTNGVLMSPFVGALIVYEVRW